MVDPSEVPAACQRLHHLTTTASSLRWFVAKSQSRVARPPRGDAQARGVLEKYVEELSDEPVGLATFGSGQACRSSGSAIAAEPSRAFEAGDFGKHNRREGEGEAKEELRDEERAELAVIGRSLNGAGGLVTDFPTDHIDFIHVFGTELAQRQGQIGK